MANCACADPDDFVCFELRERETELLVDEAPLLVDDNDPELNSLREWKAKR